MTLGSSLAALVQTITNRLTTSGSMTYAHFGLGFLEARLLYVLSNTQPTLARRVAERMALDPSAISRALVRLTERGLVVKSPQSKRVLLLTDEGLRVAHAIRSVFEERSRRLVDGVSIGELRAAQDILEKIQRNLPFVAELADDMPFRQQAEL